MEKVDQQKDNQKEGSTQDAKVIDPNQKQDDEAGAVKSKKTVGFSEKAGKEHSDQSINSDSEEEKEEEKDKENEHQIELPVKPKVSVQDEIQIAVKEIEKKNSVKRPSAFFHPKFTEMAGGENSKDESAYDKADKVEEVQKQQDPIMREGNGSQEESSKLPERPQFGVQEEIKNVVRDIEKKRSFKRQSTFSQIPKEIQQEDEDEEKEEGQKKSEPKETDAANIERKEESLEQQAKLPDRPKVSVQDEIVNVVRDIEKKRSMKRQSTFSQAVLVKQENNEEHSNSEKDSEDESQTNEENNADVLNKLESERRMSKKPNALQEVITLNEQIGQKRDSRRKSNFALLGQPRLEAVANNAEDKKSNGEQQQQIGENPEEELAKLSEDHHQDEEESKLKEGEEEGSQLLTQQQHDEAVLQRQKKKKNIMDYKEAEKVQEETEKEGYKQQQGERKMVFFKDSTATHNKKVIHPTSKTNQQQQQQQPDTSEKEEQDQLVGNKSNISKTESIVVPQQTRSTSSRSNNNINIINNQQRQLSKPIMPTKEKKPERRDEFALQRKLEYLTAKQAKTDIVLKRDVVSHNKFMASQLSKEIKVREANKKKRELESMLAQLNHEIEFMRQADPDYESLSQMKQEQQRLKDENKASHMSSVFNSSRQSEGHLLQPSRIASPLPNKSKSNKQDTILPPIKTPHPFQEMVKVSDNKQAKQEASSFVQKMLRDKELKRKKRGDELASKNDHIQREVEIRRIQNERFHEKQILERRQEILFKKQKYEQSKAEQQKLILASKNFVKDLNRLGPGSVSQAYASQVGQIDEEHKFGPYVTPELDAYKLGLKEIRKLNKADFNGGGSVAYLANNKGKDNSHLKKLLEENQINRDRELLLLQNRNDYLNNKDKGSKGSIHQQQRQPQQSQQQSKQYAEQSQQIEITQNGQAAEDNNIDKSQEQQQQSRDNKDIRNNLENGEREEINQKEDHSSQQEMEQQDNAVDTKEEMN